MSAESTTGGAIDALVAALNAEFAADPRGRNVARLLGDYARAHDDWRRFALGDARTYTRNLIERTTWYELLVLCWGVGHESPIHCHAGQNCWMSILAGEIEEVQFERPRAGERGALRRACTKSYAASQVAYINDDIALHLVRPRAEVAAVSLHLYSRPIETCNVYDPATGVVAPRTMAYHSVRGQLVARG